MLFQKLFQHIVLTASDVSRIFARLPLGRGTQIRIILTFLQYHVSVHTIVYLAIEMHRTYFLAIFFLFFVYIQPIPAIS